MKYPAKGECRNTGRTHFKKGQIPWNKELKYSQEVKDKISENRKGKNVGKDNHNWKNGQYISRGYVYLLRPNHPFATKRDKYVKRSRLVMEEILGRFLAPKERIHHKGTKYPLGSIEDKQDDRPENLQLLSNESEHQKLHWKIKKAISL